MDKPVPLFKEDPTKSAVIPVCIPWNDTNPGYYILEDNATTLITGWGRRSNDLDVAKAEFDQFRVSTPILQKVRLPVANNKCSKTDFFTINNETQVCAGGVTGNN